MKPNIAVRSLAAAAVAASLLAAPQAFAATAAGTKVSNSATVDYKIGGVSQTQTGTVTPAEFVVDRKVALTVTEVGDAATTVSPGASGSVEFLVSNTTNDAIDVALSAETMAAGTTFLAGANPDLTSTEGWDGTAGVSLTYTFYSDAALTQQITYIDSLDAGSTYHVWVKATMPVIGPDADDTKVQNADIIVVKLTGTAHSAYTDPTGNSGGITSWDTTPGATFGAPTWDTTGAKGDGQLGDALTAASNASNTVDNVFADTDDTDVGGGGANDGKDAAYDAYKIGGAVITVNKRSAVYWDPVNLFTSPKAIPGAMVLYCITVTNAGDSAADEITVGDTIPTNTTFENGQTDTDPSDGVVAGEDPLDPDGAGTTYPALSNANSIRFSTQDSCATTDWDDASKASPPAGSTVEGDASESLPADGAAWTATGGVIGNYNSVTPKVTTTVQGLAIGSPTAQYTTTMFLVKID